MALNFPKDPVDGDVFEPTTSLKYTWNTAGSRWDYVPAPAGYTGSAGADGADGTNGTDGADGTDGAAGAAGATGPQGSTGATGAAGPQGPQGNSIDGATISGDDLILSLDDTANTSLNAGNVRGPAGNQGPIGPQGIDGTLTTFISQSDTPTSYTGQGGKFVAVNSSATALEFVTGGGGGGGATTYAKTYYYQGTTATTVGTTRLYIHADGTITDIRGYLRNSATSATGIQVNKNGSSVNGFNIPGNQNSYYQTGLSLSISANDYITVDITTGSVASDLYVTLIYTA